MLSHLPCCARFEQLQDALERSEAATMGAVYKIIACVPDNLTKAQLQLPRNFGGVGMRSVRPACGAPAEVGLLAASTLTERALDSVEK